jgi:hypothetical protein
LNDELTKLTLLRDQQANLANSEAEVAILDTQILQLRAKLDAQTQLATKQAEKNQIDLQGNEIARETLLLNQELTKSQIEGRAALDEYTKLQKKAAQDAQMAANQVNQAVKAAIVNGIVQSIQAMMTALVKGTNVIQAVGSAILGLFADLAIQVGTIFLSTGIGMLATKFLDPTGAITAGLGLIALGSLMKAAFSGGGVTGGANTGVTATGGGVAFTGDTQTLIQQNEERDMVRAPQTVVNFQVMGDILDSSDTQNRIVSLLNDAIDTKGAVIRGV